MFPRGLRSVLCGVLCGAAAAGAQPATQSGASPALSAFVRETLTQNPGVQAAEAAVRAGGAREQAAAQPLYNPELEVGTEETDVRETAVGLSQSLDWSDKREARTAVAGAERNAVAAALARTRQEVATELLLALSAYQTAADLEALSKRRLSLMQRFRDLATRRQRAGDISRIDLDLARLTAAQARLQRARIAAERAAAEQAMAAVAGELRATWPSLPKELPPISQKTSDDALEALLMRVPQVQMARFQIAAARATVGLRARERRPDPTVGFRVGREDSETLAGLSVSLPLFVRNTFRAEVDVANAELIRAERQAQDIYRRAKARLLSAAQRYQLTHAAWEDWQQSGQASLESQLDLIERSWQAGELSTPDYLIQLNQALDTRAEALRLRGQYWEAWFDWLGASGRIDEWLGLADPAR